MTQPTQRLSPIEPRRLYRQIATILRDSIDAGRFPAGSLLPPERDLAEQLGVSRTSVREALIALEVQGRVSVRVGIGVLVLAPSETPDRSGGRSSDEPPIGPLDLLDARIVVETETAARAAANATVPEVQALRGLVEQMLDEQRQGSTRHVADRAFHLEIARIAGNAALLTVVAQLWDARRSPIQDRFESLFAMPERFVATQRDHELIVAAIADRLPDAAREAMRRHLARVRDSLLRAIEQS
jgi:DNA-binding FadR family transcriptional regulator